MLDNGYRVDVEAVQGTLTWLLTGCVPPAPTPTPTATATPALTTPTPSPTTTPTGPPCPPAQPQGSHWQLRLDDATHSQFVLWDLGVTPRKQLWQGGSAAVPLRLQESGAVAHLTTWRGASVYLERWLRWDWTRFSVDGALLDAVQQIDDHRPRCRRWTSTCGASPRSPRRSRPPPCRPRPIAARTYAAKRADRVLMPTPADQNWTGWKKETEGTNGAWGLKWKAAVDATSGRVVADAASGALIDALLLLVHGRPHRGRALRLGRRGAVPARRRRLDLGRRVQQPGRRSGPGPPG